jgi:hypothetical protein
MTEVQTLLWDIAIDAYNEVIETWEALKSEGAVLDHEIALYAYKDGTWSIDHAQYVQNHRGIISSVAIAPYESVSQLADELELYVEVEE